MFTNKETKAKFVEALRSGKYNQTNKVLRDNDGYCCLGVLCDIVDADGWNSNNTGFTHKDKLFLPDMNLLENCGVDWEDAISLAKMNDKGDSFSYIADHVEAFM